MYRVARENARRSNDTKVLPLYRFMLKHICFLTSLTVIRDNHRWTNLYVMFELVNCGLCYMHSVTNSEMTFSSKTGQDSLEW